MEYIGLREIYSNGGLNCRMLATGNNDFHCFNLHVGIKSTIRCSICHFPNLMHEKTLSGL